MPRAKKLEDDLEGFADYAALVRARREALAGACLSILKTNTTFVWEIGCGHGHFLAAYAAAHPRETCIGVDLVPERIARAEKKRDRARLPNLHFIRADARDFLAALLEDARFSRVFILFPDPWPKRRHHKHRIMQPGFLQEIAGRAGEGARLYFRTDYTPYFTAARSGLAEHASWRISDEPWPFEEPTVFQKRASTYHSLVAIFKGDTP
jgi:tRNA (guanine-N7-)-methyltransferase